MSFIPFSKKFTEAKDAVIDYSKLHAANATEFSSEVPYHIPQLYKFISARVGKKPATVFDGNGHVGGFTLPMAAKMFPASNFTTVEIDAAVYKILQYNIRALRLANVTAVQADTVAYLRETKSKFTFMYFDFPFGGPEYRYKPVMMLSLGNTTLVDVIKLVAARRLTRHVFCKVPTNFQFSALPFRYECATIMAHPDRKKIWPDYIIIYINV
jgi:hypothetical protein